MVRKREPKPFGYINIFGGKSWENPLRFKNNIWELFFFWDWDTPVSQKHRSSFVVPSKSVAGSENAESSLVFLETNLDQL